MINFKIIEPKSDREFQNYYHLRWSVLRKPWDQPIGSERDDSDKNSIHRMIVDYADNAIAVGRIHYNSNSEAQIRYMAVRKGFQRMNYGGKMLNCLELLALEKNISRIILQSRQEAIGFYEKNGFSIVKKSYLLFDSIQHFLMEKKI